MALEFTTPIITVQGFSVENAYGRVSVVDNPTGTQLQSAVELYVSEALYLGGALPLHTQGLDLISLAPYNRDADGVDILDLGHDNLIQQLADQGVVAVKLLS